MKRTTLPFTAIVGQQRLKQALLLNAINPSLLGVLIRGEKGTAKSTAVRALADLLPEVEVLDCPFNCSPASPSLQCGSCGDRSARGEHLQATLRKTRVVELPLGATEDRVTGTLDIEKALTEGRKVLEPGILAEVNQGILYIDEVNLLDDHLVDVLLDAAAMGINTVEREGISVSHPSRFILVGTMNPEEGEIRPQLLDRFGLSVDVRTTRDEAERIEIIKAVEDFERDPESFAARYEQRQEDLRERILVARDILRDVEIAEHLLRTTAAICIEFEVHGHRADFLIARAAKTIAAFEGRTAVVEDDIGEAAEMVLPHRMRRLPFEEPKPVTQRVEAMIKDRRAAISGQDESETAENETESASQDEGSDPDSQADEGRLNRALDIGTQRKAEIQVNKDKKRRAGSGRRAQSLSTHSGKYVKARLPEEKTTDIAIDATLRAAVLRSGDLTIAKEDLREKVRAKKVSSAVVFVVDASGSMAAMRGLEMAKRAVLALLEDSYQKRDKVGFIAVAGDRATVLLPPTSSVELAVKCLKDLPPAAGRTPLSDGLLKGLQVLRTELWKNKHIVPIMVLVSDGRGNVALDRDAKKEAVSLAREIKKQGISLVVIDTDDGFLNLGYNREIADAGAGDYYRLDELDYRQVIDVVKALGTFGEDVETQH